MYYLFAGDDDHPQGGVHDFMGLFNTIAEARKYATKPQTMYELSPGYDWWHIADKWMTIVEDWQPSESD